MRSTPIRFGAVLLVAAGAVFLGCSKDENPTNPGPGGTVLNLSLAANGGTESFTFNTAGTFPYKCGIHPTIMVGNSVTVDPNSVTTNATVSVVGLSTPGFSPSSVIIKVGGTVQWVNPTGMLHTVVND